MGASSAFHSSGGCGVRWRAAQTRAPRRHCAPLAAGEEEALRPPLLEASDDDEDGDIVARLNLRAQFLGRALAGQAAPGAQPRLLLAGLAAAQGALARPDQLRLWPLPAPADDDLGPPPGLLGEDEEEEEEDVGPPALADQDFDEEGDSGDEEGGVLEGGAGGGGGGGARPAPAQQDEPPPVDHRGLEDTNSESEGSDDEAPLLMVEDSRCMGADVEWVGWVGGCGGPVGGRGCIVRLAASPERRRRWQAAVLRSPSPPSASSLPRLFGTPPSHTLLYTMHVKVTFNFPFVAP